MPRPPLQNARDHGLSIDSIIAGSAHMNPVKTVEGKAYPLGLKNVDTDVIIPAHYLKTISRSGLGKGAFETIRAQPGNVFDNPDYVGAPIIIAGDNFGCGSSREHAAWALNDMGVGAVIAPSFSDIFSGNAFKNGIVAVVLPQAAVDRLLEVAKTDTIHIDLENKVVTTPFQDRFPFEIDDFRRNCLINGLDEIGLTLSGKDKITRHEERLAKSQPWLIPVAA
jgi:3-isopropylmalate dehydratase small subunit